MNHKRRILPLILLTGCSAIVAFASNSSDPTECLFDIPEEARVRAPAVKNTDVDSVPEREELTDATRAESTAAESGKAPEESANDGDSEDASAKLEDLIRNLLAAVDSGDRVDSFFRRATGTRQGLGRTRHGHGRWDPHRHFHEKPW